MATGAETVKRPLEDAELEDKEAKKLKLGESENNENEKKRENLQEEIDEGNNALDAEQEENENDKADNNDAGEGENATEDKKKEGPVTLGPKTFNTSTEMVDYFHKLLHSWPVDLNLNMYEQMVLKDLLVKGHRDAVKKIGPGVRAFQVRINPEYDSKCFYFTRIDGVMDDFSYRKCVDSLIPLPEHMKGYKGDKKNKQNRNQQKFGRGSRHGGGRHHGRGRGRGHGHGRGRGRH
eukprot:TRINITY_DN783_c0_g1_i1.p1 TRINITY_DN783_c0_g1~~TRINITY_DN783_c0_g1_i1.p1  ORF type:complete len:235 (+),score=67.36 TRINITY_DN783_c0_g1_i1:141-845(+)